MHTAIVVTYVSASDTVHSISASASYRSEESALADLTSSVERMGKALAAYRLTLDDTVDHHNPRLSQMTPIAIRESDITGTDYWKPLSDW